MELKSKDARMEAESGAMCFDNGRRGHEPRKGRGSEAGKGKKAGVSLESSEGRQAYWHLQSSPVKWT